MKLHLFIYADSETCPDGKAEAFALCGRRVVHPDMRVTWAIDNDAEFPALNSIGFCTTCIKGAEAHERDQQTGELKTTERFYLAAIVDGQSTKQEEI